MEEGARHEPAHAEHGTAFRLLKDHPGILISGLYLLASAIGMLDSWWYYRQFGVSVFLYSDLADFLLASFRSPTTWLVVLFVAAVATWEHVASLRRSRSASKSRVLRMFASRRYRQTSFILSPLFAVVYIVMYAGIRADAMADGAEGQEVHVSFATSAADDRTAVLLGSTLNFVFLLDRAAGRVSVHPYENVLAIESNAPRPRATAD
jgi:hypothetical protein